MLKKFYLDSCIWRDYFEDRKDILRPLGEFAFQFLNNCKKKKFIVLFSGLVVEELKSDYSIEKIIETFSSFRGILIEVPISDG